MPLNPSELDSLKIDRGSSAARYAEGDGKGRRWLWIGIGLAVVAAVLWFFMGKSVPEVQTASAQPAASGTQGGAVLNASGYVVARRLATVSSKVTGKIEEVLVEEGASVQQGQVLARLDDATARAQYELANRQLDAAQRNLAEIEVRRAEAARNLTRIQTLREQKLVSETALDTASSEVAALTARLEALQSEVSVAQSSLKLRQRDLDDLTIRAPFAGVVISKDAQPGEMVSPISAGGGFTRTGIATVVDMDSREIEVDVNEAFINRVKPEQPVEAILDAYPDAPLDARVINIVPAADRQKATVKVRIAFKTLEPRILTDMGVKVRFLESAASTNTERAAALSTVPSAAITQIDGNTYVWVVKDDRLEQRAVKVGDARNEQTEIIAGVRAGEVVVSPAQPDLKDGARVKVKQS